MSEQLTAIRRFKDAIRFPIDFLKGHTVHNSWPLPEPYEISAGSVEREAKVPPSPSFCLGASPVTEAFVMSKGARTSLDAQAVKIFQQQLLNQAAESLKTRSIPEPALAKPSLSPRGD